MIGPVDDRASTGARGWRAAVQGLHAHGWPGRILVFVLILITAAATAYAAEIALAARTSPPHVGQVVEGSAMVALAALHLVLARGVVLWRPWGYRAGVIFGWVFVVLAAIEVISGFVLAGLFKTLLGWVWLVYLRERRADFEG